MDVRAQIATVFHLDKCLGCHTCSVACKNIWTDRRGAECMWWNNVEAKPGTGYPARWEDQDTFKGGWELRHDRLRLRSTGRARIVANIFHNPHMPTVDDYYEPWTYDYDALFSAPETPDQPVARAVSLLTGRPIDPSSGPNWDDDLGGSPVYAENDPNLGALSDLERQQMFALERMMLMYLPRTCNHCLNPACVAACPSGALHKRGEDGVVLIDQERCRAWRACVPACPYKKTFYNWATGKSEKCILCFPRLESGQPPACFHSCVGRIRYVGVLLYDASRIREAASCPEHELLHAYRELLLDPGDSRVAAAASAGGMPASMIDAARRSPVYRFVKDCKLARPLHLEVRTLPTLFYVPPLSPVVATARRGSIDNIAASGLDVIDQARIPLRYLASLFGTGDDEPVRYALRKQQAVREYRRGAVDGASSETVAAMLQQTGSTVEEAEAIYHLTSLATPGDRFVVPAAHREQSVEELGDPLDYRGSSGFGAAGGQDHK